MSHFKAKMHQIRFRVGLRPRPRWGSLQRSPHPLAGFIRKPYAACNHSSVLELVSLSMEVLHCGNGNFRPFWWPLWPWPWPNDLHIRTCPIIPGDTGIVVASNRHLDFAVRKLRILTSGLARAAWVAYRDVRTKSSIVPASHGRSRAARLLSRWRDKLERTVSRTLGVERTCGVALLQTDELSVGCSENGRGWRGRPA